VLVLLNKVSEGIFARHQAPDQSHDQCTAEMTLCLLYSFRLFQMAGCYGLDMIKVCSPEGLHVGGLFPSRMMLRGGGTFKWWGLVGGH
jgi:hypothetical protein